LFFKLGKESKLESQMIKAVSDEDMTMTLINNCKVSAAGLTQIQIQKKKDKKAQPKKETATE
jgi:hypothetical protein